MAASTTAAAGRTTRFGMMCRSTSVAEIATSAAQKNAATAASQVSPKRSTHAATRNAVVASTSGYRHGIAAWQWRQRPRSSANESSGTLSYHASGVPHAMHAEPGLTSERRSGMRAATTFRKLPNARPGQERDGCERHAHLRRAGCCGGRCCRSARSAGSVFAGVLSSASDTDSAARGGRALDAL